MIRRTKEYILENKMIKNHSTVLVALSGGADSVCLLLVLNEIKRQCANELDFALEAVHVEHGIRGAESREDARFASDLCERLNIPCHVHSVDVPQYAKSHGLGLEEAARILRYEAFEKEVARILRYEAFEEEAGRYPCETADASDQKQGNSRQAVVAVAHHMEDNAETVLFQMLRGSGAKGLAGMHPVSVKNGVTYIRPLLSATRAQIEEYLMENGQAFVTSPNDFSAIIPYGRLIFLPDCCPASFTRAPICVLVMSLSRPDARCIHSRATPLFNAGCRLSKRLISSITLPSFFETMLSHASFSRSS